MPLRLSYSSLELLNTCERKFQLTKLLQGATKEDNEHFSFGRAFGAGVAEYAASRNETKALWKAWLAYWPELETEKKFQTQCFALLRRAFRSLDDLLQHYDVVFYNDKVAAELAFRLDISPEYYFVGHIDLVLRHKITGIYTVLEVKSSSLNLLDLSPAYINSGQAIGYSVALDSITGQKHDRFEILYLVGQLGKDPFEAKIQILKFRKSIIDRLNWFVSVGIDVNRLGMLKKLNIYPKRGKSCMSYRRPCQFIQTCGLTSFDFPKEEEPDETHYHFQFQIDELIDDHLARIASMPAQIEELPDESNATQESDDLEAELDKLV